MEFLKSDKFEPLDAVSDHLLTQKALFLILLASGRRNGEITNLSRVFKEVKSSEIELYIVGAWIST